MTKWRVIINRGTTMCYESMTIFFNFKCCCPRAYALGLRCHVTCQIKLTLTQIPALTCRAPLSRYVPDQTYVNPNPRVDVPGSVVTLRATSNLYQHQSPRLRLGLRCCDACHIKFTLTQIPPPHLQHTQRHHSSCFSTQNTRTQ